MSSLDELLNSPALQKLARIMEAITFVQENLNAVVESDDDIKRKLIKERSVQSEMSRQSGFWNRFSPTQRPRKRIKVRFAMIPVFPIWCLRSVKIVL